MLVKTSELDEPARLIEAGPETFYCPPYPGSAGWIGMRIDDGTPDWAHVRARIRASWCEVAPASLREALDA